LNREFFPPIKELSGKTAARLARMAGLGCFLVFMLFPLVWIVITSFKPIEEIYTFPIRYLPSRISLESYRNVLKIARFGIYFKNSLIVSILASAGGLCLNVISGFALSRLNRGRVLHGMLLILYFTQMLPGFILMIPLFNMISKAHLSNSLVTLTVLYGVTTVGFGSIMSKSFFDRIPPSLEEAALIDGCTPIMAIFRVILPVSLPELVAIFCFLFVGIWNELWLAVMLISDERKLTVPVALNGFISKSGVSWDIMSAGIVLALLPTMLIFAIGQKYIVASLTEGGLKG
jgi:multiple sugar transport system permease protein